MLARIIFERDWISLSATTETEKATKKAVNSTRAKRPEKNISLVAVMLLAEKSKTFMLK